MIEQKIEALSDFVFLRFEKEKKTKSGIVLSEVSNSRPVQAIVVAVGPGRIDKNGDYIKTQLKPKDKVIVDPFLPKQIKIDGEELWVCQERDIYAKIK